MRSRGNGVNTAEEDYNVPIDDERRRENRKWLSRNSSLESSKLGIVIEKLLCIPGFPAVRCSEHE